MAPLLPHEEEIRTRNRIYWSSVFTQTRNLAPAAGASVQYTEDEHLFTAWKQPATVVLAQAGLLHFPLVLFHPPTRGCRFRPGVGLLHCLTPLDESDGEMLESLTFITPPQIPAGAEEPSRECREQEYQDRFGNCRPCTQCEAGQELSKVGSAHFPQR